MATEQLQRILAYTNEDILSRFEDQFTIDTEEIKDIFTETKKFLYLVQQPGIFIPDELLIVDEMWHNFILFTKEYQAFCNDCFGRYLHHLPASKAEKELQRKLALEDPARQKADFEKRLSYVIGQAYDLLGETTVRKWFAEYPARYSKTTITQLRKY
jgi:hypothetical protein